MGDLLSNNAHQECMNQSIREFIGKFIADFLYSQDVSAISYNYSQKIPVYRMAQHIRNEKNLLVAPHELYVIHQLVKATSKVDGSLAEVGVYRGATAKMICKAKKKKTLYLFDTFEGLPPISKYDKQFFQGQYQAFENEVRLYLRRYKNIQFYKGLFPQETGKAVVTKKFSFVHLDVDIYKSTKDCLEFFYPRMSRGGVILSHDYVSYGVKKAVNEFFSDKCEPVIELPGIQCMVVKI